MKKTNKIFSLIMAMILMWLVMVYVSAGGIILSNISGVDLKIDEYDDFVPMSSNACSICTNHEYKTVDDTTIGHCSICGGPVSQIKKKCKICNDEYEFKIKTHNSGCQFYGKN